jgi:hypothetical protein
MVSVQRSSGELASMEEVMGAVKRWGWLAVVVAVLAGAATWMVTRPSTGGTAVVRIAVDRSVNWPYYDVVRQRPTELIKTNNIVEKTGASTIEIDAPAQQAYIDVNVTASDPNAAIVAADKVGQELILANRVAAAALAKQASAQTQAEVDALTDRLNELQALLDQAIIVEGLAQQELANGLTGGNNATVLAAQAEREKIQRERSDVASQVEQKKIRLTELTASVTAPKDEIAILQSARLVDAGSRSKRLAVLAALVFGGLAALLLPVLERMRGKVTSAKAVERSLRHPVLARPGDGDDLTLAAILRADLRTIAVLGTDANAVTAPVAQRLGDRLAADRTRQRVVIDARTRLADAVGADGIVVLTTMKKSPMRSVDRMAADIERLDLPVVGVIVGN